MKIRTILLGAAACAAFAAPAFAQSDTPKKHRESVESRLNKMEQVIEDQQAEIKALKDEVAAKPAAAAVAEAPPPQPEVTGAQFEALQNQVYEQAAATRSAATVTVKKLRPTIASSDGKNTLSIRADVMADYAAYTKSAVPTAAFNGANGEQQLRDGFNFRRAQFGIEGKIAGDFSYRFIYDFGGAGGNETGQINTVSPATPNVGTGGRVKEMWVGYTGFLAPFTFKVGAGPWPANLEDATASDDLLLDERASPAQLSRGLAADDGRDGLGFIGNGDIWNFSTFLTGDSFGKGSLDGQGAVVSRAAVAPVQDSATNFNVHLGANASYVFKPEQTAAAVPTGSSAFPADLENISFSDRPELRVTDIKLINTGNISADSAYTAGLEFAMSYQAFQVQSEYFWYGVERRNPATDVRNPNFHGWYVEGSYVLTGEPRTYSMASASFTRPSPAASFNPGAGNWGAWELAARYSNSDLNFDLDSATTGEPVKGGEQNIWSAGLNFYPNDNVKFMFDWQDVSVVKATIPTKYDDFIFRTQLTL